MIAQPSWNIVAPMTNIDVCDSCYQEYYVQQVNDIHVFATKLSKPKKKGATVLKFDPSKRKPKVNISSDETPGVRQIRKNMRMFDKRVRQIESERRELAKDNAH
jgi:hypothetical protein